MKDFLREILVASGRSPRVWRWLWSPLAKFVALGERGKAQRVLHTRVARDSVLAQTLSPDLVVLNGPFAGLRYLNPEAAGSSLINKLLGSYEQELHPVFERIKEMNYDTIIDIGAAEGYYAIGLALRYPKAKVIAFEASAAARQICSEMARFNGCENRIEIRGTCSPVALRNIEITGRALIICDCEGYEDILFDEQSRSWFARHDIVVELHDGFVPGISWKIEKLLRETHSYENIIAIEDVQKALRYDYPELAGMNFEDRMEHLSEARHPGSHWGVWVSETDGACKG